MPSCEQWPVQHAKVQAVIQYPFAFATSLWGSSTHGVWWTLLTLVGKTLRSSTAGWKHLKTGLTASWRSSLGAEAWIWGYSVHVWREADDQCKYLTRGYGNVIVCTSCLTKKETTVCCVKRYLSMERGRGFCQRTSWFVKTSKNAYELFFTLWTWTFIAKLWRKFMFQVPLGRENQKLSRCASGKTLQFLFRAGLSAYPVEEMSTGLNWPFQTPLWEQISLRSINVPQYNSHWCQTAKSKAATYWCLIN